jgi:hypothetical protein
MKSTKQKLLTLLVLGTMANFTASCTKQIPQQIAALIPSESILMKESHLEFTPADQLSANAASFFNLGAAPVNGFNKNRLTLKNSLTKNVSLNLNDLYSKFATTTRWSVPMNAAGSRSTSCGASLLPNQTCYVDIQLNYVISEDYSQPVEVNLLANESNPQFGKVLFTGTKALDSVVNSIPLINVMKLSAIADNYLLKVGKSLTKRFYLGNVSAKSLIIPTINAPATGSISKNTCTSGSNLLPSKSCYFEITYNHDGSSNVLQESVSFISQSSALNVAGLEIRLSVINQPAIIPIESMSVAQVGGIYDLSSTTQSTRLYVTNTGSGSSDLTKMTIPAQFVVASTSCSPSQSVGSTCFYDLKIDPTKTPNMVSLQAPVTFGNTVVQIGAGKIGEASTACAPSYTFFNNVCMGAFVPNVAKVTLSGGQLKIEGSNLSDTATIKIKRADGSIINTGSLAKTASAITAQISSAISFAMNEAFQIILSDAAAQQVPVDLVFSVADGSITNIKIANNTISTAKLAGPLGGQGVTQGQSLVWNGSEWSASNPATSQMFISTYDALAGSPAIEAAPQIGDYYIISKEGSQDLNGSGAVAYKVGDQIIYDGSMWKRVASSNLITSVFGRIGNVVAQAGDYSWSMLKKAGSKLEGSSIGDIADIDLSVAPQADQFLGFDTVSGKWIPKTVIIPSQQVVNSNISDNEIAMSKVNGLSSALGLKADITSVDSKDAATLISAKSYADTGLGLKADQSSLSLYETIANFEGDVRNLVLTGLPSISNAIISATDSILGAFGKLNSSVVANNASITSINGSISSINTSLGNKQASLSAVSPDLAVGNLSAIGFSASTGNFALSLKVGGVDVITGAALTPYMLSSNATPTGVGLSNLLMANNGIQVKGNASGASAFPSNDSKAALDIAGSAITRTYNLANTISGIDLSKSNSISVAAQSAAAVVLNNIQDGGAYTIAFTDSTSVLVPSFTATGAELTPPALTVKIYPTLAARTSGKHFVASVTRIGSFVYMSWQEF